MTDASDRDGRFRPQSNNEMRALVRAKDWSQTALGPIETWSPSLRLALEIVLSSGFPMALRWGHDFVLIYNDGYRLILGAKHPWALGLPARIAWSEVWPEIEPFHLKILNGDGEAVFAEDRLLRIQRHGEPWEDAYFTLSYSPTPDPTAPTGIGGIFVTAVETTARVQAERQRRAAEEALRRLNESLEHEIEARTRELNRVWTHSRDLLVVIGTDGIFRAVSPAWTEVLGHVPDAVVGRSFLDFVYSEDAGITQAALNNAASGAGLTNFENRYRHSNGDARWISWHTAVEGDMIYAYGRDITAMKVAAAELAVAQEALRQSQKMEAIGQLTGGIAHDFNNMLAIVIGSLDIAGRRIRRGEAGVEKQLDVAREGAKRAATLTERLLAFSRQSPLSPRILNINNLVARMSELLRSTLGERISL